MATFEKAVHRCLEHGLPYDDQGTVVRVHGAFQDISKAKAAEAQVRELAERLTMTLESIADGFLILDRDWRVGYLNSFGERLLQRDRHTLLGKVIWDEFPDAVGTHFHREYERCMKDNPSCVSAALMDVYVMSGGRQCGGVLWPDYLHEDPRPPTLAFDRTVSPQV